MRACAPKAAAGPPQPERRCGVALHMRRTTASERDNIMRKHELEQILYLAVANALGVTPRPAPARRARKRDLRGGAAPSRREQRVLAHA